MKALILVGGFGTRLRPLTLSVPKPLVDFANVPIVVHQIAALAKVGVKEVVLAVNTAQPQIMQDYMKDVEEKYKIKVSYSIEDTPMGTAGPLKLAEEALRQDNEEGLFFVFNSDVTCDFPLQKLVDFHKAHGQEGTIMLTQVQDPSKYGVVLHDQQGLIQDFIEKPQKWVGDKINAGLYIFNTSIIDRIEMKPTSIERVIFPKMAAERQLYALTLEGFWMDIGQPKDYLLGQSLFLNYLATHPQEQDHPDRTLQKASPRFQGNVLVHPSAQVAEDCLLGPDVVIGKDCVVGSGARIKNCAVLSGTKVGAHSHLDTAIIGWHNTLGKWTRVHGLTVTGEDVQLKDEVFLNKAMVLPHKGIAANVDKEGTIIM